jgi:hypothetical protein
LFKPCSSPKSGEDTSDGVTFDDLHHLYKLVEEKDGGLPWIQMMDKSTPTMSYQAWRREPKVSYILFLFLIVLRFNSLNEFLKTLCNFWFILITDFVLSILVQQDGPPQYRSSTIFEDATPEIVRDLFWDDQFRPKWDDMLVNSTTLEECPTTGTMKVQWIRKVC